MSKPRSAMIDLFYVFYIQEWSSTASAPFCLYSVSTVDNKSDIAVWMFSGTSPTSSFMDWRTQLESARLLISTKMIMARKKVPSMMFRLNSRMARANCFGCGRTQRNSLTWKPPIMCTLERSGRSRQRYWYSQRIVTLSTTTYASNKQSLLKALQCLNTIVAINTELVD